MSFVHICAACLLSQAALELVETRFVCIMQHDRTFMRPFHDVLPLLKAMMADDRLKMAARSIFGAVSIFDSERPRDHDVGPSSLCIFSNISPTYPQIFKKILKMSFGATKCGGFLRWDCQPLRTTRPSTSRRLWAIPRVPQT